jgi:hypothetical protein
MPFPRSWHSMRKNYSISSGRIRQTCHISWGWIEFQMTSAKGKVPSRTQSTQHSHSGHLGLAWFLSYYSKMRLELLPNFLVCSLILLRIAILWILIMSLSSVLYFTILMLLTTIFNVYSVIRLKIILNISKVFYNIIWGIYTWHNISTGNNNLYSLSLYLEHEQSKAK